jgi:uncharacterized protein (TIGR02145 family)
MRRKLVSILILLNILLLNSCKKDNDLTSDADGNVYKTVKIGSQLWFAENLKTSKYNDGSEIPLVLEGANWTSTTTGAYCWYENDPSNYKDTYGALYNWYSVNTGKLCPTGWHVPTDNDWKQLEMFLGMSQAEADIQDVNRGTTEGDKLKEGGIDHWVSPNTGATNEYEFTALPGGYRDGYTGVFAGIGYGINFWTLTELDATTALDRGLRNGIPNISRLSEVKTHGFYVRCIRN